MRIALIVAIIVLCGAGAAGNSARSAFFERLTGSRPNIRWDASSEILADLDGDGKIDSALLGYASGRAVLAVAASSNKGEIQYLEFPVGQTQESICSIPAKLSAVPLTCEMDGGSKLPGCIASRSAIAMVLDDGDCDSINLYWNRDKKLVTWWRN